MLRMMMMMRMMCVVLVAALWHVGVGAFEMGMR